MVNCLLKTGPFAWAVELACRAVRDGNRRPGKSRTSLHHPSATSAAGTENGWNRVGSGHGGAQRRQNLLSSSPAIPCSGVAQQSHNVIEKRVACRAEESVSVGHGPAWCRPDGGP